MVTFCIVRTHSGLSIMVFFSFYLFIRGVAFERGAGLSTFLARSPRLECKLKNNSHGLQILFKLHRSNENRFLIPGGSTAL